MRQTSHWLLVLCCGVILTVEAPLVFASLAADFEGAYPTWDSTQASALDLEDELLDEAPAQSFGFTPVSSASNTPAASLEEDELWGQDGVGEDDSEALEVSEALLSLGF